jgi:hypothetical protein
MHGKTTLKIDREVLQGMPRGSERDFKKLTIL